MPAQFRDILDGTSNTIMLLQNPAGIPWMEPQDLDIEEAVALVTRLKPGETLIATFYDASTRRIKSGLTAEQVRPFFTWKDGEIVDLSVIVER
jgi:hypothetical protein